MADGVDEFIRGANEEGQLRTCSLGFGAGDRSVEETNTCCFGFCGGGTGKTGVDGGAVDPEGSLLHGR